MQGKTAIIGNGESVLAFKAGGVDAYFAENAAAAREMLRKLAKKYQVIFLTDDYAKELDDLITRMLEQPYPIVISVPTNGSSEYAKEKMKEQMERALGVDILFQREGK